MAEDAAPDSSTGPEALPTVSRRMVFWTLVIACVVSAVIVISALSRGKQTPNEALLLSLLLTILSVAAGWLITHTFYQDDKKQQIAIIRREYENNLEVYAIKASEKLINLSNQMARLISFIDREDFSSEKTQKESYKLLCERQRASVHMLETLKSMNDTSLSDWEGVIGDRLDAKRRLDEQRDYDINELIETIKSAARSEIDTHALTKTDYQGMLQELKELTLTKSSLPASRSPLSRPLNCPQCSNEIRLRTNSRGHIRKTAATCSNCKSQLVIVEGKSPSARLIKRERVPEQVACISCSMIALVELDNAMPAHTAFTCDSCGTVSIAVRNDDGVHAKGPMEKLTQSPRVNPDLVEKVMMMLPPQPWPTGIHREIAEKLDITATQVGKAIQVLINARRVQNQIDGVVVDEASSK